MITFVFQLTEDGSTTNLISSITQHIDDAAEPGTIATTGVLDFSELIAAVNTGDIFTYQGSFTTPPCTDGVTFLVLEMPLPLDVRTYNAFKRIMKFNSRFTQNTLGLPNLLDIAAQLAISEDLGAYFNLSYLIIADRASNWVN